MRRHLGLWRVIPELTSWWLCRIEENAAYFLKYGYYTGKQLDIVSETVTRLCAEVRTYAISLVDSFCYSDHIINSPFGRYDGDGELATLLTFQADTDSARFAVYRSYFDQVRAANPHPPVHPYFERIIKPLITRDAYVVSSLCQNPL